jgi:VWFA-related protein
MQIGFSAKVTIDLPDPERKKRVRDRALGIKASKRKRTRIGRRANMAFLSARLIAALIFATCLSQQSSAKDSAPQPSGGQGSQEQAAQSPFTLRTFARMVNVELVVKDAKGNHIPDLKAGDFQVFEQTPSRSGEKHEQKISQFREVHMVTMAAPVPMQSETPKGVYTNAVTLQKDPVPATILLVDGLNTDVQYQAQVHVQMLKMLRQLPTNVPIAVFLLGNRLELLQSFTTDPKLLQAALSKLTTPAGVGIASADPRDDANSTGNLAASGGVPGGQGGSDPSALQMIELAQEFDQELYAAQMGERVQRTINALVSIAHNASGYPGRKNLLWLSTTFPLALSPNGNGGPRTTEDDNGSEFGISGTTNQDLMNKIGMVNDEMAGQRSFWGDVAHLGNVLSDAQVAVYPVNLAGVETLTAFQAGAMPVHVKGPGINAANTRQVQDIGGAQDTMMVIADGTGGKVCTGDNDLGDCVHKAVDDSSDYYEISYYPDSGDWRGDFRNIIVKTGLKGVHLSYRQGYYATPEGNADTRVQAAEMQSDCQDYLDATAVDFKASQAPSDIEGQLKFSLQIDSAALTIPTTADGGHKVNVAVAVCTYNEKDWPQTLMNYPVSMALDAKKYEAITTKGQLGVAIQIPAPKPPAIRILVKDVATGKLGSVYVKTADLTAEVPKPADDPNAVFQ